MLARQDNLQTIDLAKGAAENARSVRAIAIVTMIFLPPSLLASIFGMNSLSIDHGRMNVSGRHVGWFVSVSALLIVVTCIVWYSHEWLPKWRRMREKRYLQKQKELDNVV